MSDPTPLTLAPPQQPVPPAPRRRASLGSRWRITLVVVVVLGAAGFLLYRGLGNAALYFRTADEAVAQKGSLGTRQFRIEGTVVTGTIHTVGKAIDFSIVGPRGAVVPVQHTGDEPQLFKDATPVVLDGHWAGTYFASDQIEIKHSEDYKTEHPDRLQGATQ
jgi:cytochrome c-type biogenesis protein CcmE